MSVINNNNNCDYGNEIFEEEYDEYNEDESFEEYNEDAIELHKNGKSMKELLLKEELEKQKQLSLQRFDEMEAKKKKEELIQLRKVVEEKKRKEIEEEEKKKQLEKDMIDQLIKLQEKISEEKKLRKIAFQTNQIGKGFKDGLSKVEYNKIISPASPIVRAKSFNNIFKNNNNNNNNFLNKGTNNLNQKIEDNDNNNVNIHNINFDDIGFIDRKYKWATEKKVNDNQEKEKSNYFYKPIMNNNRPKSSQSKISKRGSVIINNTREIIDITKPFNVDKNGNIIKKNKKKYTDEEKKFLDRRNKKDSKRKPLVVLSMKDKIVENKVFDDNLSDIYHFSD
jgi:hypothetical protein